MKRRIVIDIGRCVGCGDCSLICPVLVYTVSTPPCQNSCPLMTDIQDYVSLIAQGKFEEALTQIRQTNPFPGIIGRVCTHPCEQECRRAEMDEPIAICALKRAAADYSRGIFDDLTIGEDKDKKVAVVGGGPAGLMAAYDLRKLGYHVTIFEALPVLGGMLAVGIPPYRLPREILDREIAIIPKLGVEIRLNTRVGDQIKFSDLRKTFNAIFLAMGAHVGRRLGIKGEECEGVIDGIEFLRDINLGTKVEPMDKTVVVGGGNVAVDCARTCLRLGFKEVAILYRRSRTEMPAIEEEVREAEEEGVSIQFLAAPIKILSKNGKVNGVKCIKMRLDKPDADGRKRPIPIEGSEFTVKTDRIISAIGEEPDLSFLKGEQLIFTGEGLLQSDPDTLETNLPGIFAGGDAVSGPATAIQALGAGKKAAIYIDQYLQGRILEKNKAEARVEKEERMWWQEMVKAERQRMPELPLTERALNFSETKLGLTRESALKEAMRCLGCKIFTQLDLESCLGGTCKQCADYCWKAAITILKK
jgi:NADPH-dependent glutamate synthase beta subunit-like oxidoreductase